MRHFVVKVLKRPQIDSRFKCQITPRFRQHFKHNLGLVFPIITLSEDDGWSIPIWDSAGAMVSPWALVQFFGISSGSEKRPDDQADKSAKVLNF